MTRKSIPTIRSGFDKASQALKYGNADLKILLPLTLFLLGVRGVLVSEQLALPTWYDLLWFSLGTFIMLNPRLGEARQ